MLQLLFNPNLKANPSDFNRAAILLIILGAFFALVPMLRLEQTIAMLIGLLAYVTYYNWVALFINRYRDAGKDPVKCLIPIIAYLIISVVVVIILMGPQMMEIFRMSFEAASEGQDPSAMEAEMEAMLLEQTANMAPKLAAAGAVVSALVAFGFNRIIGPSKTQGAGSEETFR